MPRALRRCFAPSTNVRNPPSRGVHGAAYGGGVGLVACCDIAIAAIEATFALSESKLGLIPATISPYVIEAIGARQARRYFLTAERFEAAEAYRIGLVHDLVPLTQLDDRVNEILSPLLIAGPAAQRECKALIRRVAGNAIEPGLVADTVERITRVRASAEGKEGVRRSSASARRRGCPRSCIRRSDERTTRLRYRDFFR